MVHEKWSDNHCNQSDTWPSILLLESFWLLANILLSSPSTTQSSPSTTHTVSQTKCTLHAHMCMSHTHSLSLSLCSAFIIFLLNLVLHIFPPVVFENWSNKIIAGSFTSDQLLICSHQYMLIFTSKTPEITS